MLHAIKKPINVFQLLHKKSLCVKNVVEFWGSNRRGGKLCWRGNFCARQHVAQRKCLCGRPVFGSVSHARCHGTPSRLDQGKTDKLHPFLHAFLFISSPWIHGYRRFFTQTTRYRVTRVGLRGEYSRLPGVVHFYSQICLYYLIFSQNRGILYYLITGTSSQRESKQ